MRVFVQLQNERELADWLDTVMRDIVARKEQEIAPEVEGLVRLLKRQAAEYEFEMAALPAVATSAGNRGSLGTRKEEISEAVTTQASATATKKKGGWFSKGSSDRGHHSRPTSTTAAPAVAERAAALAQREAEVASGKRYGCFGLGFIFIKKGTRCGTRLKIYTVLTCFLNSTR